MSVPEKKALFLTPSEVVIHNKPNDLWVIIHGKIYNLTRLAKKYEGKKVMRPLIAFAGKDISHWFDPQTGELVHYIHPVTGVRVPYCPHGPIPDVGPQVPTTAWKPINDPPWWKNEKYIIGYLTQKVRVIRVINTLTGNECTMQVCSEDTINRIAERYKLFNTDSDSYTWRYDDKNLNMNQTLGENNIPDEGDIFYSVGLPDDAYIPALLIYYNDDLKYD